jgi:hypothetical protein
MIREETVYRTYRLNILKVFCATICHVKGKFHTLVYGNIEIERLAKFK